MKFIKQLFLISSLTLAGTGCIDDGLDVDPKPDEEGNTGSVEQAVCGTGVYYNQCREYGEGALWNQVGCPNQWRLNFYDGCEQYTVNTQWRHQGCNTYQSYLCSPYQYPARPFECYPQC